jgi:hypothetical protein
LKTRLTSTRKAALGNRWSFLNAPHGIGGGAMPSLGGLDFNAGFWVPHARAKKETEPVAPRLNVALDGTSDECARSESVNSGSPKLIKAGESLDRLYLDLVKELRSAGYELNANDLFS